MKTENMDLLREALEQVPTDRLDEILQKELQKTPPDGESIRLILEILEERDEGSTETECKAVEKVWEKYRCNTQPVAPKTVRKNSWMLKAASIALIIGLLLVVVPQEAKAKGLFDRIARWTSDFFELFSDDTVEPAVEEYVFETDNPGLQQVYDAVTELGVTEPVVPMWLPGDYVLETVEIVDNEEGLYLSAGFDRDEYQAIFEMCMYYGNIPSAYFRDDTYGGLYEMGGTEYIIARNNDIWLVIWNKENIECSISIDCREDEIYRIIESIYTMEGE